MNGKATRRRWPLRSKAGVGVALIAAFGCVHAAAPTTQGFHVTVDLVNIIDKSVACKRALAFGPEGAKVDIACAAVPPVQDSGPSRFMLQVFRSSERIGTIDTEMDPGTVTSWRVVRASDREYLEMTVGW